MWCSRMTSRRIEFLPLRAIQAAKRNVKDHNIGAIHESVKRFGFADAVVIDERTGSLVAGHGRVETLLAMEQRGEPPPNGIEVRDGVWLAPVQRGWASRNDAEAEAFLIAANRTPELGGWNQSVLDEVLCDLSKQGEEALAGTGFSADYVDKILREMKAATLEADPEPLPRTSTVQRGDLFILGEHRLLCGDSTNPDDVRRLMGGERAVLMNTDPPYGVSYDPSALREGGKPSAIANDDLRDRELQQFLERAFAAARAEALTPNAAWYLWHAHLTQGFFAAAAAAANVVLHRQIIWVKPQLILGRGQYHWRHEPCFFGWVDGHQPPDYGEGDGERTQTTVWEIAGVAPGERRELNHSTPKPTRLFEIPIVKHTRRGEICYEPFAGSGPQILAAQSTGRRCFAIEIDPLHVQSILDRWVRATGVQPVKSP